MNDNTSLHEKANTLFNEGTNRIGGRYSNPNSLMTT